MTAPSGRAAIAAHVCSWVFASAATSADNMCFLPVKSSGDNSDIFVEPKSKVCRAFQQELNANCAGEIPTIEFRPTLRNSGLTEPVWEPIALYAPAGTENADAFALLEKLIWSRAVTGHSQGGEEAAKRDVERIMGQVRAAHADALTPRFDKVSLDLEGRGRKEILYRLYSGLVRNPMSVNDANSWNKSEPNLFLERALAFASREDMSKDSSSAAGNNASRAPADVLMFEAAPYFLTISGSAWLVYASYLQPNRPEIPDEKFEQRTFIMPQLRCMFEARPTH